MKKHSSVIIRISFLPALLLALNAAASPAEKETALSWRDCVELAVKNNPVMLASAKALSASKSRYLASWNSFFPQLSLNNGFSRNEAPPDSWSAGIGASENIFNLKAAADIRVKKASVDQFRYNYLLDSAATRYNLLSAYLGMLYSQENLKVAESILALREKNARMVSLQYAGGKESKGNNMRAAALALQARADLSQAKRQIAAARVELAHRMGLKSFENFAVTGTFSPASLDETTPVDAIIEETPQVLLAKTSARVAREQLSYARADLFPVLTASQSLNWRGGTELPSPRYWSLGFNLSLPLFSGGPTFSYHNISSASRLAEKARLDLEETRLAAKTDLQNLLFKAAQAADAVLVTSSLLEAAQQRHNEAEIQYISGRMIFQNWELVEQDLVNFESSLLRSQRDLSLALAAWDKSRGIPLGE